MPKQTVFERGQKLGQPRKQNIKRLFFIWREQKKLGIELLDIWKLFETEEEKDERKMQEHNE